MVRLFSLNIERSRHLDRFLPILAGLPADVACLQEVSAGDLERIRDETGLPHAHFFPMAVHPADTETFGVAIFTRQAPVETGAIVYAGRGDGRSAFDRSSPESRLETCRYAAAWVRLAVRNAEITIATTHFPWTPDGEPRPFQVAAAKSLVEGVGAQSMVISGDFNAPRGGPVFAMLAEAWTDCIPPHVTTSIDPELHRAGPLELMVDGLFCTGRCQASDVRMLAGLSDHQAVTGLLDALP